MGPGRAGVRATILRAAWSVHRRQRSSGQGVVQHPVQAVPGAPVAAHQVGHAGGFGGHGQVGDAVAHGPRGATAPGCQRRAPLANPTDSLLCRSHTTYKLPVHNTRDPVIAARSHRREGWSDALRARCKPRAWPARGFPTETGALNFGWPMAPATARGPRTEPVPRAADV